MLPQRVGIIIPTCGVYQVQQMLERLPRMTSDNIYIHLVLVNNPKDFDTANSNISSGYKFFQMNNIERQIPIKYTRLDMDCPVGFGRASNIGINYLLEHDEVDFYININDDCIVTKGWLTGLWFALKSKMINTQNRLLTNKEPVPITDMFKARCKGIGMVGPVSNITAGSQLVKDFAKKDLEKIDPYSRDWRVKHAGQVQQTEFLSGFCTGITHECLIDVMENDQFYDESFKIGGYEDNDVCNRLLEKNWGMVVAVDTFVGHYAHSTLDTLYPEQNRGVQNKLKYLLKYEKQTQGYKNVCGVVRVAFKCVNDLAQYYSMIKRSCIFVDSFAILLTNDISVVFDSYDRQLIQSLPKPVANFLDMIRRAKMEIKDETKYFKQLADLLYDFTISLYDPARQTLPTKVEYWDNPFNEREERNKTHEMADELEADWCFSIDADEVIEDRLTPKLFRRWLSHPNPNYTCMHVGWINHWETMNLVRVDKPFTNGLMRMGGPRLWKRTNSRIVSGTKQGLHCGNAPFTTRMNWCSTGLRFRHLSYVRGIDRLMKSRFYNEIDQDFDTTLVGNTDYSHLVKSERVQVSLYNPANGIAGFFLCYEEEKALDIALKLDYYYGILDRIVAVWTGEWADEDKQWLQEDFSNVEEEDWNFKTGPSWAVYQYCRLFKVEWIHTPLTEQGGLALCRNSALEYLRQTNNGSLGWVYFFDPDEQPDPQKDVPLYMRGMAELNDTWGFLFRFANPTYNQKEGRHHTSISESIRMFKLEKQGLLKFEGKVHETLDISMRKLMEQGVHPNIQKTDIVHINLGLNKSPEKLREKLQKYQKLLVDELKEKPLHSASWLALGLQLLNDNDVVRAKICLERSVITAGQAFLPFRELAFVELRNGLALLVEAHKRLSPQYPWTSDCEKIIEFLQEVIPETKIVDTGIQDVSKNLELPAFPYDKVVINNENQIRIEQNESNSKIQEE